MFLIGIFLIASGYFILFNVPQQASAEAVMRQAMAGMALSIIGAVFIMLWIFKKTS